MDYLDVAESLAVARLDGKLSVLEDQFAAKLSRLATSDLSIAQRIRLASEIGTLHESIVARLEIGEEPASVERRPWEPPPAA